MPSHKSLRDRLEELFTHHAEPRFELTGDPVLRSFAQISWTPACFSFDANKHLRTDALAPIYDCETESRRQANVEPEPFVVTWAPVWQKRVRSPVSGPEATRRSWGAHPRSRCRKTKERPRSCSS